jgi:NADH:ubiquinone oxidoreductase subunit 2 (subunit N)
MRLNLAHAFGTMVEKAFIELRVQRARAGLKRDLVAQGADLAGAAGLVASVVAGFYYLRIIKLMWFDPTPEGVGPTDASPVEARTIAWASAAFSFPLVIVAIGWIDHFAGIAATGFGAG